MGCDPTEEQTKTRAVLPEGESASARAALGNSSAGLLGRTIGGRYAIVRHIGKGGMSSVFLARDLQENRDVAVKTILPHLLDEQSVKRFEREAVSVQALDHKNIVKVFQYAFDEAGGVPFIVMEYIDGPALSDLVATSGMPFERAVPIFVQIAEALEHAHQHGVVHRDLKPSNVLVRSTECGDMVGIVDFGLAKLLPQADVHASTLTATGDILGSPLYMSPEQCLGQPVTERSDIYSFGCLMFEALTGKPPLLGETPVATILKQIHTAPPSMFAVRPDLQIPPALDALAFKALQKDPARRLQSMTRLLAELKSFVYLQASGLEYQPVSVWKRFEQNLVRKRKLYIIAGCLATALLGCWYFWLTNYPGYLQHQRLHESLLAGGALLALLGTGCWLHFTMCKLPPADSIAALPWKEVPPEPVAADELSAQEECVKALETADVLFSQRKFEEARLQYSRFLPRWEASNLPASSAHGVRYGKLGDACSAVLKFRNAEESYLTAFNILEQMQDSSNSALAFVKYAYIRSRRWQPAGSAEIEGQMKRVVASFGARSQQAAVSQTVAASNMWQRSEIISALRYRLAASKFKR